MCTQPTILSCACCHLWYISSSSVFINWVFILHFHIHWVAGQLSLSHTHTHTHTRALSHAHTHSRSHTHTHTPHTHTHTHLHTLPLGLPPSFLPLLSGSLFFALCIISVEQSLSTSACNRILSPERTPSKEGLAEVLMRRCRANQPVNLLRDRVECRGLRASLNSHGRAMSDWIGQTRWMCVE